MASETVRSFFSDAQKLQSFDMTNGSDTITIYWKELPANHPGPSLIDYVKGLDPALSDDEKKVKIMFEKWRREAMLKVNLGMEEAGEQPFTEEEWAQIPGAYMEYILSVVGSASLNFFNGPKKVQKP